MYSEIFQGADGNTLRILMPSTGGAYITVPNSEGTETWVEFTNEELMSLCITLLNKIEETHG